jgi:para-nitrobenzyl esterase
MASPLSRNLIAGAIGESGSILGTLSAKPLAEAEEQGRKFAASLGAADLAALRALPAAQLLEAAGKSGVDRFSPAIDGYFFPEAPLAIYAAGKQAHVPLLAGWNSEESNAWTLTSGAAPNRENVEKAVRKVYPADAEEVLKEYPASTDEEAVQAATDLAGDRFIAYSTWKWIDLSGATGGKPVYRYDYERPRPAMNAEMGDAVAGLAGGVIRGTGAQRPAPPPRGAVHSAEIEYAMGNLSTNKVYAWTPDDYKVSAALQDYFANFIKTGDPNGRGLVEWPAANAGGTVQVMHIGVIDRVEPDRHRGRYLLLDRIGVNP